MRTLLLVSFVGLTACGGEAKQLDKARELWMTEGSDAYSMTVQHDCLCPDTSPVQVTVVGSAVFSASRNGTTLEPSEYLSWFTINGLFDEIQAAVDANAHAIEVEYGEANGHPIQIDLDFDQLANDDELAWTVSDLVINQDG